jgi:folate-binding protein YgfZ
VTGEDRRDFLHRLAANDVRKLRPGDGIPTLFLERTGRVIARVIVADRGDDFLLVGDPGRARPVIDWIEKYTIADDVAVEDVGDHTGLVTVLGAGAPRVLADGLRVPADELGPWEHRTVDLGGGSVLVLRAEDVGGRSFHVVAPATAMATLHERLAALPLTEESVYDALRVEAGVPAFGTEYDERTIPLETRLTDAISLTKGCFLGQEVVARLHHHDRVKRALVRVRIEGTNPPRAGAPLRDDDGEVGVITSAARLEEGVVALGYVAAGREAPGTRLAVGAGPESRSAEVLPLTPAGDPSWSA